jgi:hypothetical protein
LQTSSHHDAPGASGEFCQFVEVFVDDESRLRWQRKAHEEGA